VTANRNVNYLTDSDEQLVQLCKEQLPYTIYAYKALITRYEPLVFQYCLRYLRSQSDAEEVIQEVFLRVFHHINQFESRSSFKTWLMKITQNQCSKRYNQLKRRHEIEDAYKSEILEADKHSYDENTQDGDLAIYVLNKMRSDDREILSLRHLSGLSLTEVADVLGISDSAAKMRHQRAVKRFQTIFNNYKDEV